MNDDTQSIETEADALTELKGAVASLHDAATSRLDTVDAALSKLGTRIDGLETRSRRPGAGGAVETAAQVERGAWVNYLRKGDTTGLERKDMTIGSDPAGGYIVAPDQFLNELLRNVVQFSPVRAAARVASTSNNAVILPKRTAGPTGSWVSETGPRLETQSAYGQARYDVHEAGCYIDVSTALLEDSAFNLEAELSFDLAEEFGRLEAVAFVNGSGVGAPLGFMTESSVAYTPSGHASQITADGLIDALHALAPVYRANSTWMMNSTTLATIRKLKDGTGNYLVLTAGLAGQVTTTLLGRPIVEAPDMPNIGSNTYPIAIGDFSQGYRIFDRVQLGILRDPFSVATSGLTRFHARRRVAAGVGKAEALRKIKIATS